MTRLLLGISVTPRYDGLPGNLVSGLQRLTDNAAGLLTILAGLGLVLSIIGIVVGSLGENPHLAERSKRGLLISIGAVAILYVGVTLTNSVSGMFS